MQDTLIEYECKKCQKSVGTLWILESIEFNVNEVQHTVNIINICNLLTFVICNPLSLHPSQAL